MNENSSLQTVREDVPTTKYLIAAAFWEQLGISITTTANLSMKADA